MKKWLSIGGCILVGCGAAAWFVTARLDSGRGDGATAIPPPAADSEHWGSLPPAPPPPGMRTARDASRDYLQSEHQELAALPPSVSSGSGASAPGPPEPRESRAETEESDEEAPASATQDVQGIPVTFSAYLYRDFQPICPPDGKALIAVVSLVAPEGKTIPDGLQVTSIDVVHGDDRWSPEKLELDRHTARQWGIVVRNGPKWRPGSEADLIVHVRHGSEETPSVVLSKQRIEAVQ